MKIISIGFIIIIFGFILIQSKSEKIDLLPLILGQLELSESDINSHLVSLKEISGMKNKSLAVIPVITEEGEEYIVMDAYILLVDNQTATIEAAFFEERAWTSDAFALEKVEIEDQVYEVTEKGKAFGVILNFQNSSRINRTASQEISIYHQKDDILIRVLKDYSINDEQNIIDDTCDATSWTRKREIEITDTYTNAFYDLKISESEEMQAMSDETCEFEITSTQNRDFYLKFDEGLYKEVDG